MRTSFFSLLLCLPMAAYAQDPHCKHSQTRDLQLDLSGVKTVVFDIGQHALELDAAPKAQAALRGQACASDPKYFAQLQLTQQKIGDRLQVSARREGEWGSLFMRNQYAYFKLASSVPDDITVQLKVGSGDATVSGASILSADVGSGDLAAKRVGGAVEVGSIGSGDFTLDGAAGDVRIGSIGSGDAQVEDIAGSVTIDSLGSGDIEARNVRGGLSLRSKGSGSIQYNGIGGPLSLPREN